MSAFNQFACFTGDLFKKKHDCVNDSFKVVFSNNAPNAATWAAYADITGEVANGNGYTTGGLALTGAFVTFIAGLVWKFGFGNDPTLTAAGGTVGPARYAIVYNNTAAGKNLVGWWDRGTSDTAQIGDTITFDNDQANGIVQI